MGRLLISRIVHGLGVRHASDMESRVIVIANEMNNIYLATQLPSYLDSQSKTPKKTPWVGIMVSFTSVMGMTDGSISSAK